MGPKSGDFYAKQKQHIESIDLPQRIKCKGCDKNLIEARFSNGELNIFRGNIFKEGTMTKKFPRCLICKPGNREELTCIDCGLKKSLDEFAKAQRKKGDNARCKDCQQDVDDRVPEIEAALVEEEIKEEIISTRSSVSGMSQVNSMQSSRPSDFAQPKSSKWASAAISVASTNEDGVFINSDPDPGRGPLAVAGQAKNRLSTNESRTRTSSSVSGISNFSQLTIATNSTTKKWADFAAGQARFNGSSRESGDGKFANLRAAPQDPLHKLKKGVDRDDRKRKEQEQQMMQRGSDDDDDDDWEL